MYKALFLLCVIICLASPCFSQCGQLAINPRTHLPDCIGTGGSVPPITNLAVPVGTGATIQNSNITVDALFNTLFIPTALATGGVSVPALPAGVGSCDFGVSGSNYLAYCTPTALSQQVALLGPNAVPAANSFPLIGAVDGNGNYPYVFGTFGTQITCSAGVCSLANTAVTAGTYPNPNDGAHIPVITFDAQGRATAASTVAVAGTNQCVAGQTCIKTAQSCTSGGLTITAATHAQGANPIMRIFSAGTQSRIGPDTVTLNTSGDLVITCTSTLSVDVYISGTKGTDPNFGGGLSTGASATIAQDIHDFRSTDLETQVYDNTTNPRKAIEPDTFTINASTFLATWTYSASLTTYGIVAHN